MASEETHLFRVEDGVGVVTFNRPEKLNAVTWDMAAGLVELFRELRGQDEVRTIVLTGAGRAFCAGGDAEFLAGGGDRPIPGITDRAIPRYQRKTPAGPFAEFTRLIIEVEKPVIAAINGAAVGAGLAYALACDRRFAGKNARLSAIFVRLGFAPDCGVTYFLPRIVGVSQALHMLETGAMLGAEEAKAVGLIDELVEEGEALNAAMAYAKELATGPSVAVDLARRFVHKSLTSTLNEMLDYEAIASVISAHTDDAKEGTSSFIEKRAAVFKGQ